MRPPNLSSDAPAGAVYRSTVAPSNPDGSESGAPRLLDRVRHEIRLRHYLIRAEDAYADWILRHDVYHGKRHSRELRAPEVAAFLTLQAFEWNVAPAT